MIDLAWNDDVFLDENGDLAIVVDGEQVASHVVARLKTILGENYFNTETGLPWVEAMYTPATTYEQKTAMIRSIISRTPGVEEIKRFSFGVDVVARVVSVEFLILTKYNTLETGKVLI